MTQQVWRVGFARWLALSRPVALIAAWHEHHLLLDLLKRHGLEHVADDDLSRFAGESWTEEEREARVRVWSAQHTDDLGN